MKFETIKETVVKAFVEGRKAKGQFGTVTFIKADGTIRTINGCFAPTSKVVGSERGVRQGEAMRKRGQIPIYSVADGCWKSFYADRVIGVS